MTDGRHTSSSSGDATAALTPGVVSGQLDLGEPDLNQRVTEGLAQVEEFLYDRLSHGDDIITDKVLHLVQAGGKRFRPMFTLLASEYGQQPVSENVIKAAAVVEMTHLATLYHDDVMDEAQRRRGVDSANARWGNSVAILAGDHLLAQASGVMAELGVQTVRHFAETFAELVTGQMRETVGPEDGDPVEHYLAVIREKTGVLIASAGYLGGVHSGAPDDVIDALRGYGSAIGMVFQIVDDIIDIFSDPGESGKTPGTDLREGVYTLPVLYALAENSEPGEKLRQLLGNHPQADNDELLQEILDLIRATEGRARSLEVVHRYLDEAQAHLNKLPQNSVTKALRQLADYTVQRVG